MVEKARETIIFLGPLHNVKVWPLILDRIFPDLIGPLYQEHTIIFAIPSDTKAIDAAPLTTKFGVVTERLPVRARKSRNFTRHFITDVKKALSQLTQKHKATIITNIFGGATVIGDIILSVCEQHGIRSVLRCAGDDLSIKMGFAEFMRSGEYYPFFARQSSNFQRADAIIVMSHNEKKRVSGFCLDSEKIFVCMRGVNLEQFSSPTLVAAKKILRFLYLGRRSAEKGFELIEQAARILAVKKPEIEFWFAGNFTPGQCENIRYFGYLKHETIPDIFQQVDAFVLPSRSEGFPQALVEAMASAKPCIVSKHLFEHDFSDGHHLMFCEISLPDLVNKILQLHEDPELAAFMSRNAQAYAFEHYDFNRLQNRYRDAILGNH